MKKILLYGAAALMLPLTSCLQAHVTDDSLGSAPDANKIDIELLSDKPGSNMVILKCNTPGIIPYWQTPVGPSTRMCDTIIAPYTGEFKVQFIALGAGGKSTTIEKSINIERFDYEIDPMYEILAGKTHSKKWVWDPNPGRGSWGPYGSGGYGWSKDVPNWNCYPYGNEGPVYSDEYIVFDLDGGANFTRHNHDGSETKGTFAFSTVLDDPAKAALEPCFRDGTPTGRGWVGTLTLSGTNLPAAQLEWGMGPSGPTYEIAVLSEDEMVLIQAMGTPILCDPNWATGSTHWCFIRDGLE